MDISRGSVPTPPMDPNRTQNRIPSDRELAMLRDIRSHRRQMAEITKRRLDAAFEAHQHIQARYNQLFRELEAAQSELNISHKNLDELNRQLKDFQAEDSDLAGLVHPIRRCPQDILVLIFEWTLEIDERYRLIISTTLSHVCKSWRVTALNTSCLWSHFRISTNDNIPAVKSAMKWTKTRIRNLSPEIEVRIDGECDLHKMEQILGQIQLRKFKTIKHLKYHVLELDVLILLDHPSLSLPTLPIERVEIASSSQSEEDPLDCNCEPIFKQSPDIKFLDLSVHTTVEFGGVQVYPSLLQLSIHNSPTPSLSQQLHRFPALQELQFTGHVGFALEDLQEDIILPQLQRLSIIPVTNFPWRRISTPSLRDLRHGDMENSHSVLDFYLRHPSITQLTYASLIEEDQLRALANSLPDLEYLNTGGDLRGMYQNVVLEMPFPPFPKLQTFFAEDIVGHRLSLAEFENFVSMRLLPQHSKETPTLKVWKMLVNSNEVDILPWRKSDLLSRLYETLEKCDFDDSMHYITLVPK